MEKEIKIGDKIWIQYGSNISECEVLSLPNEGKLVEWRKPFGAGRLSFFGKLFWWYFIQVETLESFKERMV